jgi:hypothetical protein
MLTNWQSAWCERWPTSPSSYTRTQRKCYRFCERQPSVLVGKALCSKCKDTECVSKRAAQEIVHVWSAEVTTVHSILFHLQNGKNSQHETTSGYRIWNSSHKKFRMFNIYVTIKLITKVSSENLARYWKWSAFSKDITDVKINFHEIGPLLFWDVTQLDSY